MRVLLVENAQKTQQINLFYLCKNYVTKNRFEALVYFLPVPQTTQTLVFPRTLVQCHFFLYTVPPFLHVVTKFYRTGKIIKQKSH